MRYVMYIFLPNSGKVSLRKQSTIACPVEKNLQLRMKKLI